jgi:hypothetical protein
VGSNLSGPELGGEPDLEPLAVPRIVGRRDALCYPDFAIQMSNRMLEAGINFGIGYEFRTAGSLVSQFGNLKLPLRTLEIEMQPLVINR